MRMDSEMNDILHLDFMHYMIVASLEMSDEPKFSVIVRLSTFPPWMLPQRNCLQIARVFVSPCLQANFLLPNFFPVFVTFLGKKLIA